MTNLYQTLGVKKTASDKEIKSAYRKLASQHHPDRNQDSVESKSRFQAIQKIVKEKCKYTGEQQIQPTSFQDMRMEIIRRGFEGMYRGPKGFYNPGT